ncbi:cell wall-binding repeat-containing protein [Clostridium sp. AWRP]|uniref:cell wall-binding repeat-containing protein n=1 Tax=Clostridium sp. AWRP TaxID=2212991 RepID=UPI000FD8A110|nr:cell wall-binding repeat-containing protein [Clostridium sp. AWRP]AZV57185.1 hypothetical protein DMR38_11550 [Clostridium sp. AWRP]
MKKILSKLIVFLFVVGIAVSGFGSNVYADSTKSSSSSKDTSVAITKDRLSGSDRIETSLKISQSGWKNGSDTVIIAQGYGYADALCAAPLAKKNNAPIILSNKDSISGSTIIELKRLKAKKAFVIGGTGSLSDNITAQLKSIGIKDTERLGGSDRYETSIKIAKSIGSTDSAVVASGNGYADSLSIAPIAASKGMPILLVGSIGIPDVVNNYIKGMNIKNTYVVGGTAVIGDNVKNLLPNAKRLGGATRFDTNLAILENFKSDLKFDDVYIAEGNGTNGDEFADALSGSALAAQKCSPIVLIYKTISTNTANFIKSNMSKDTVLTALGGTLVVPDAVLGGIEDLFNGKTPSAGIGDPTAPTASTTPTTTGGSTTAATTGKFKLIITKDNGKQILKSFDMDTSNLPFTQSSDKENKDNVNSWTYLEKVAAITKLQGPGFINGIQLKDPSNSPNILNVFLKDMPIAERQAGYFGIDWFIYKDGVMAKEDKGHGLTTGNLPQTANRYITPVGALNVYPYPGDTLIFDYHKWDWHSLVAPNYSGAIPLELHKIPTTIQAGQSFKLQVQVVYRGIYNVSVKVDGQEVAKTDIDGYATISINNPGTHKITAEKDGGIVEKTITVSGGGSSGGNNPPENDTQLVTIDGTKNQGLNLTITEKTDGTIKIDGSSKYNNDYITINLYDSKGNLVYVNQCSNGAMNLSTNLSSGDYTGVIKASSTDKVNVPQFSVK